MSTADPLTGFVAFTRALRAAGVRCDRSGDFVEAIGKLDAGNRDDVYWAGRTTLCDEPDDIPVYDRVFRSWFASERSESGAMPAATTQQKNSAQLGDDDTAGAQSGDDIVVSAIASSDERLKHRDVADLSADERRHLARLFGSLHVRIPWRRNLRKHRSVHGDIDIARTVRDQLRRGGEPGPLRYRSRQSRPRRIVLLIDVSGSMEPYADSLLRLAHRVMTVVPRSTEVFTLGTRLTRVTQAMRQSDPEDALASVAGVVPDWSGGTRLGEVLQAFADRWGQRGIARRSVVVIASDGWERGDPSLLGEQVRRLRLLAHSVIWANPHRGKPGYAPVQGGIMAAMPSIDGLVAGHSLASFSELLEMVGNA